jgi:CrcB protein
MPPSVFHGGRLLGVLSVAGGGLVGSLLRVGLGTALPGGGGFPVSTLTVNLVGSLMLGLFLARRERAVATAAALRFWAIGLFGALTTFSGFAVESVELLRADRYGVAAGYALASIGGGLALALAGHWLGSRR